MGEMVGDSNPAVWPGLLRGVDDTPGGSNGCSALETDPVLSADPHHGDAGIYRIRLFVRYSAV